jgi:hypothetical protein
VIEISKKIHYKLITERYSQTQNYKKCIADISLREAVSVCFGEIYRKNILYDLYMAEEKLTQNGIINYEYETWNLTSEISKDEIKKGEPIEILNITLNDSQIKAIITFKRHDGTGEFILFELTGAIPSEAKNKISVSIVNNTEKISLYINNELQDEDWTLGNAYLLDCECKKVIDDWFITNDLSIDKPSIKSQSIKFDHGKNIQGWKPDGHNTGVGDCMPFWDVKKQILHLFYLFDRRGHKSKCGLEAHQWGHIYRKNNKEWVQCPMAISIDRQEEGSICTGSVIYYKEKYIAFYAVRMSDGSPAQLSFATSDNCIQFK